jgi:type VI secretion system protein ImpG
MLKSCRLAILRWRVIPGYSLSISRRCVTSSLKKGIIEIDFFTEGNISARSLDLNKLTFWLGNEDNYTRHQLYLWFSERLMDAELVSGDRRLPLPDLWLEAAGFEGEDALLPAEKCSQWLSRSSGIFLLPGELFLLSPARCDTIAGRLSVTRLYAALHFNQPLPVDSKLRRDSLRLYCTPAINLFLHYAEPVSPDGSAPQFPLTVSHKYPDYCDIFQVKSVYSKVTAFKDTPGPSERVRLWPEFESFQHQIEYSLQREVIYWHHRTNLVVSSGSGAFHCFVHADGGSPTFHS